MLLLLFAFNHQNYSRYLMYYPLEFQTLKHNNSSTYEQSKTYKMGISWTRRKISSISGDLVTEVAVNREVKICGGPKRGGYSISVEAVDDFILNIHTLAKLGRALKNRMNAKTSSNHKEFSHWQQKTHEQYIKQLLQPSPPICFMVLRKI